jgi:hypothetical protein
VRLERSRGIDKGEKGGGGQYGASSPGASRDVLQPDEREVKGVRMVQQVRVLHRSGHATVLEADSQAEAKTYMR